MPHARARKVTDQPSLPSFPLLFVSVGKIKKVWGGVGTFYFDTISNYKKLQKYTKIFYTLPVCNSVSFFPLSLSALPQEFEKTVYGYIMTFVSYLQCVFPKEGVFSYTQVR